MPAAKPAAVRMLTPTKEERAEEANREEEERREEEESSDLVDIHSIRPGAGLSREQRTQAVQLLGRRCSSSDRYSSRGRVLAVAAADTMIPLAHMLLTGDDWDKLSPVSITLGVGGKRRVLDAPMVRALGVELLMAQRDGRVVGAALLTKAAPQLGRAGFVVPQLVAVDETVENSGVGSALLEAA